jgi:heptosyltransferase-2
MEEFKKILIIRLSSLGDVVLTTPVIKALKEKFPQSEIYFLTKGIYSDVLKNNPFLSSVIKFNPDQKHSGLAGLREIIRELAQYHFDLIIDLHSNLRSFFIRHLLKAEKKIRYKKRVLARFFIVYFKWLKIKPQHTIDSYLLSLRKLNIKNAKVKPEIFLDEKTEKFAQNFLWQNKIKKDDILVGISPGAKWETKRWDGSKFLRLCQILLENDKYKIVLFGSAEEKNLVENLTKNFSDRVFKGIGLSLLELSALIGKCEVFVSNDSGLMHIATAMDVPVIAIFGPTHPNLGFSPLGERNVILTTNEKCSPCSLHGEKPCKKERPYCFEKIFPEEVADVVIKKCSEPFRG